MAFSGLIVSCVYTGGERDRDRISLPSKPVWSEDPGTGVTSANAAPAAKNTQGLPVFRCYAAMDSYLAIGVSPDETASPRMFIPALQLIDILVEPGDKFAWAAA